MNQLIKLTKFGAEKKESANVWVNVANIAYVESGKRKQDNKDYTVVHFIGGGEHKTIVTESPDDINLQLMKVREIKIVL